MKLTKILVLLTFIALAVGCRSQRKHRPAPVDNDRSRHEVMAKKNEDLSNEVDDLKKKNEALEQKIEEIEASLEEKKNELSSKVDEIKDLKDNQLKPREDLLATLKSDLAVLSSKIKKSWNKADRKVILDKINLLKSQKEEILQQLVTIYEKLDSLMLEKTGHEKAVASDGEQLSTVKDGLEDNQKTLDEIRRILKDDGKEKVDTNAELVTTIEGMVSEVRVLRQQVEELTLENNNLRQLVVDLNTEFCTATMTGNCARARIEKEKQVAKANFCKGNNEAAFERIPFQMRALGFKVETSGTIRTPILEMPNIKPELSTGDQIVTAELTGFASLMSHQKNSRFSIALVRALPLFQSSIRQTLDYKTTVLNTTHQITSTTSSSSRMLQMFVIGKLPK